MAVEPASSQDREAKGVEMLVRKMGRVRVEDEEGLTLVGWGEDMLID